MSIEIQRISPGEFDALEEEWNALLAQSESAGVFLRWEWIHTWWSIFKDDQKRLLILAARLDGRLVGIAPFYIHERGPLLGKHIQFCSEEVSPDYMDIFTQKGSEAPVAQAVAEYLLRHSREWDKINLDCLRRESCLLTTPSLWRGFPHAVHASQRCPYIRIQKPFDDYFAGRSELKSFSLRKKWRQLQENEGVRHHVIHDPGGLSKGLDDLFFLHERRAQDKNIQSNFTSPRVKQFHQDVGLSFLKAGILNLQLLYAGQSPAGACYAFNYNKKVCLYQMGFDPVYAKRSVGSVTLLLCIEKAFQEEFEEFDFLKGTESYKSLWADAVHDEMRLTVYNKSICGSLGYAKQLLKNILKRLSGAGSRR